MKDRLQKRKKIAENREWWNEYNRKWRAAHPDKVSEYNRINYERTGGSENARIRVSAWVSENPERAKILTQRRRARKMGAEGSHTVDEWKAILKKHKNRCAWLDKYPGESHDGKLTKDHIIPLAKGGTNFAFNLQPLCQRCNSRKNAKVFPGTQHSLFDKAA